MDRDMLLSVANSLREYLRLGLSRDTPPDLQFSEGMIMDMQRQFVWLEGFYRATAKNQVARSRLQRSRGFPRSVGE